MSQPSRDTFRRQEALSRLANLLLSIPSGRRGALLQSVASFRPQETLEESFDVGPVRAAFAEYWEAASGAPVPVNQLRAALDPPVPMKTVLEFSRFMLADDLAEIESGLDRLVTYLQQLVAELDAPNQLQLFGGEEQRTSEDEVAQAASVGDTVASLEELVQRGRRFPTIYADPPWPYQNEASRGAAANHYPTMSLSDIRAEPVSQLAEDNAHLHLWTTNGFLREALDVIDVWGFSFKSCLVWIKHELGMGNYWRVSHEYLLLGVRGNLTFRDRTLPSWIQASRTIHSRKPGIVRALVERASPGPYLELYGREELPNSAWTVYGNQIERRFF